MTLIRSYIPNFMSLLEIQNLKFEIWNKKKIWHLKSEIQILNPKSEIWNLISKIWNPKSEIWQPKSEIQNLKSEIWVLWVWPRYYNLRYLSLNPNNQIILKNTNSKCKELIKTNIIISYFKYLKPIIRQPKVICNPIIAVLAVHL